MVGKIGSKTSFANAGLRGYGGNQRLVRRRRGNRGRIRRVRRFNIKVRKAMENMYLEKNNFHFVANGRIEWGTAGQAYTSFMAQNSGGDLTSIFNKIGTSVAGVPAITSKAQKFTVDTYVANITMKNQCNTGVICDLYVMVPRNDMQRNPATLFAAGMIDQNATSLDTSYGVTPYMCNLVTTNFKILQKTRYLMAPGTVEIIEIRDTKKYEIDYQRVLASTGSFINVSTYKGWSKIWFAVVRGEPYNDSSTHADVSTTPGAIDWITNETYYYSYVVNNAVKSDSAISTGAISTGSSVVVQTGTDTVPTDF